MRRAIGRTAWLMWLGASYPAVGATDFSAESGSVTNLPPTAAARGDLGLNLVFVCGVGVVVLVLAALAIRARRTTPPS